MTSVTRLLLHPSVGQYSGYEHRVLARIHIFLLLSRENTETPKISFSVTHRFSFSHVAGRSLNTSQRNMRTRGEVRRDTVWIDSGRLGSGPLGSVRVHSGRLGSGPLGSIRVHSGRLGSGPLGLARFGSARVHSGRLGLGRLGSARFGSGPLGTTRVG